MNISLPRVAILLVCLIQHPTSAQTLEWRNGVAKVTTKYAPERAPGTAFVFALRNNAAYLVTGSHVVAGDNQPQIDFLADPDKTYRAATVISNNDDQTRGLAILRVNDPPSGLRVLPPGEPVQGANVIVGGFPAPSAEFSLLNPIISRIEGTDVVLSQDTPTGYSGGPVVHGGKVVGLVFGRLGEGKAVQAEVVSVYLRLNKVPWTVPPDKPVTTGPKGGETATPARPQGPKVGETRVNPIDQQTYVYIPPGKFMMGCSKGDRECDTDENPPHEVEITRGFWIGRTETTQDAWSRVMGQHKGYFTGGRRPVEYVDWTEAKAFCETVKMRLPTEAEWEYAARAGSQAARYGAVENIAWYGGNSAEETHRVAQKTPNGWGLYDTLGNVWEWVNDWYGPYSTNRATDPRGPANGGRRVVRGGSWVGDPQVVRVSDRVGDEPSTRFASLGFRCAGELP